MKLYYNKKKNYLFCTQYASIYYTIFSKNIFFIHHMYLFTTYLSFFYTSWHASLSFLYAFTIFLLHFLHPKFTIFFLHLLYLFCNCLISFLYASCIFLLHSLNLKPSKNLVLSIPLNKRNLNMLFLRTIKTTIVYCQQKMNILNQKFKLTILF